jgi:hypothetical protein
MKEFIMIKKSECLNILRDLREAVKDWGWEDDYHGSGLESKSERLA